MTRIIGAMVLLACVGTAWAAGPPAAQDWERFAEIEEATRLNFQGIRLFQAGKYPEAVPTFAKVLAMREALYPKDRFPRGHPYLAQSLNNLAALHRSRGDLAAAEPLLRRALAMREALYPKEHFPQGQPYLAVSLTNMARLHWSRGDLAAAEPLLRRALAMREALYPKDRFPQGHPDLALSLTALAVLHTSRGDQGAAEPLHRRALAMYEALYPSDRFPQGHPDLARGLSNLAALHRSRGDLAAAEPLQRRALAMREALYPKEHFPGGHPELAASLSNLAALHESRGDLAAAVPLLRRALAMNVALYSKDHYPRGHPDLALSLNYLAVLHDLRGDSAAAEPLLRRALAMYEALYPKDRFPRGHLDLAAGLNNLAGLHRSRGDPAAAEPLLRRALAMYSDSAASVAAASDATALNLLASQPLTRDAYLSVTRHLPRAEVYPAVWQTRAALARVAEARHLAVLAAESKEARGLWDAVLSLRRERERLLLAPAEATTARARDARLEGVDEAIRKKEEELRPLLPTLKRSEDIARATPADMRNALPADAAFIDLLRYTRFEQDPKVPGEKGDKRTPHYVAFVLTRSAVVRVELGEAKPIEEALALWRRSIIEASPSEPKYAAEVHSLVWAPLLKHFPSKTAAVYVSPDAALNALPWAALRDSRTNRILIEDHAVAVVPHGPMLLDRLTDPKRKARDRPTLLAMGGVAYDKRPGSSAELAMRGPVGDAVVWAPLKGTAKELQQLVSLAGERKVIRREGDSASADALLLALPQAETAHLATHGFFADPKFRTVFQLDPKLFDRLGTERSTAGARNPLVLSGLVCAGANVEGTPNRGVVTADSIVGLDLRKMNLAVLSACETGLGDVAGGEGVYGLVRAFHVAGARNVVASLWKVDDEATAALMVLFYRQLWGKEPVPPIEALRRAQLAIYREPGRIPEWSQGRGPIPRPVAGSATGVKEPMAKGKTSPARAWAAFVLSGLGD